MFIERAPFDIDRVTSILRTADVICVPAGVGVDRFDPYRLSDYRAQAELHGCRIVFLFDLNVLRRIDSLHPAAGVQPLGEQERLAAALMAFAVYANVLLEPGLALMEWFSPAEREKAAAYLRRFRELDNTNPEVFATLALGWADHVLPHDVPVLPPVALSEMPERPTGWHFDYTALLKVAILTLQAERANGSRARAMEDFLVWCWRDFLFSAPAIHFGGLYLSQQRRKRMFKGLRSRDPQKALAGIANAAWDLAYLREWGRCALNQRVSNRFHLLCSLDRALRDIASDFLFVGEDLPLEIHERYWKRLWGHSEGRRLLGVFRALAQRLDDSSRAWRFKPDVETADHLKHGLELELRRLVVDC